MHNIALGVLLILIGSVFPACVHTETDEEVTLRWGASLAEARPEALKKKNPLVVYYRATW